jgi:hypothetical protein
MLELQMNQNSEKLNCFLLLRKLNDDLKINNNNNNNNNVNINQKQKTTNDDWYGISVWIMTTMNIQT